MKKIILSLTCSLIGWQAYAQTEKDFKAIKGTDTLWGTCLLPAKPSSTAVIIIAGSGPTDRNGNNRLGVTGKPLQLIAEGLTNAGYITLRYDKRGIGQSAKAYVPERDNTMDTYINDVALVIESFRKEYPDVKKLIVIGHSEGALLAMPAIAQHPVQGYVSLSGMCDDMITLIGKQLKTAVPDTLYKNAQIALDSIKNGHQVTQYHPMLASIFHPSSQPFLISAAKYSPAQWISKTTIPVLIVNGTADIQVDEEQARCLKAANPTAELVLIENMNHVLKVSSKDRAENIKTYTDASLPLHEELVPALTRFIEGIR